MTDFDILKKLIEKDRSIRRFKESHKIEEKTILELIDLTRYCASGRNLQPLKYRIVQEEREKEKLFSMLAWAGYLTDWDGPAQGERPNFYLVQCLDPQLTANCLCDDGLQIQAITLGASAKGIGCCIIKSFNKAGVKEVLGIPEHLDPLYILAMGVPNEEVKIEPMKNKDEIKYYRTPDGVHHVPKRGLDEIIVS